MKNFSSQKGFTLTELLIVIGLIAILSAAAITIFNPLGQIEKSNDAKRKSDLSQISRALELYYNDTGRYPPSTLDYRISYNSNPVAWNTAWQPYMAKLPADPKSPKTYVYYVPDASGQTYYIYAGLDRGTTDAQACNGGSACSSVVSGPGANACGGTCNFGISSPNVTP
jgi:general secretion pathway protein G